ncbi:ribonuclease D [Streptomyces sp. MUM 203J]|uniref:HRDC domain-containing protein n=1 Tax=Streptomyces sp. MUM 203J TaxID=2791990 RepID=UPI001F04E9F5|nr:ribonuclease D [Streptomyces sp. MUM 203J]MCH0538973.1 ribonuclease D [Streptomyces sp. MUM 203J]
MTDARDTAAKTSLRTAGGGPPDDGVAAEGAAAVGRAPTAPASPPAPGPVSEPDPQPGTEPVPLLEPREGIPPVVADADALAQVIETFAEGTGPVAVDAERASGYRYGQRAYLVQLRREGAGTALIDPVGCPDLSALGSALDGTEWILHAATQDLPCLREIGMVPSELFDTELAGRLAGFPRVGLGAMVESVLGFVLEKGHSAVDWSTRPLPEPWLRYAALDVELLVDLRDALEKELDRQGKLEWARQEFAAIAAAPPPPPRKDPWRRTSGMHKVRRRRQMAVVRELWTTRDRIAQRRDVSPGKVLSDAAIVEAALALPSNVAALTALPGFGARMGRRQLEQWQAAVDRAKALPDSGLPQPGQPVAGPPPPRSWADKDPAAAARLSAARAAVSALAEELNLPQENLITPDTVRRVCWEPPEDPAAESVAGALAGYGARPWQIEQVTPELVKALRSRKA